MPAPYRAPIPIRNRAKLNSIHARGGLYDFLNYSTEDMVKYEQDFLGNTTTAIGTALPEFTVGGANSAAGVYAQGANGTVVLVTASNGCSLYLNDKNFLADQNCTIKARFQLSAITTVKVELGFVDSNATAVIGATGSGMVASLAATPTLNTGASDGTCVIMDTAGTGTNPTFWKIVGSKAGTTKRFEATGGQIASLETPVATTYQTITLQLRRVAIVSEDVDAEFWVNGVSMGVMRNGGATFSTNLYPYIIVYSASAARTLTLDYFNVYQQRDMTN